MKDAVLFQTFSFNNVSNSIPGPMHRHPSFFNWVPVALKSTPSSSSKTRIRSRSSTRKETALPAFVSRMQRPLVCWNTRWFFSFCFLHVSNYWFADLSVRCTCLRLPVRCTQTGSDTLQAGADRWPVPIPWQWYGARLPRNIYSWFSLHVTRITYCTSWIMLNSLVHHWSRP